MSIRSELSRSVFFEQVGVGLRFDVVELPAEWAKEASDISHRNDPSFVKQSQAFWKRIAEFSGMPLRHVLSYDLWEYQTNLVGELLKNNSFVEELIATYGGSEDSARTATRASIEEWRHTHAELTQIASLEAFVAGIVRNSSLGAAFRQELGMAAFPVRNALQNDQYLGSLSAIASDWLAERGVDDLDLLVWQACSGALLQPSLPSVKKAYLELANIEIPFAQSPGLKAIPWEGLVGTCYGAAACTIGSTAIGVGGVLVRGDVPSLMLLAGGVTPALVFVALIPALRWLSGLGGHEASKEHPVNKNTGSKPKTTKDAKRTPKEPR